MNAHIVKLYALFFFVFVSFTANAQSFTASAGANFVGKNGYVTIRYEIKDLNASSFQPPVFTDFDVVSGPNQESGMTSVNGAVTRYVALSFVLRPKKTGSFTIPPATIVANGKTMSSNSVTLKVNAKSAATNNIPAPQYPPNPLNLFDDFDAPRKKVDISDFVLKKGENVAKKVENNLILKVNTSRDEVYIGEPIVASYEFYSRLKSDSKITKNPSFNNFSVVDMQTEQRPVDVNLNGKVYTKNTLRKVQLYPQLAGSFPLETVSVDNDVIFFTEEAVNRYSIDDLNSGFGVDPSAIITEHVLLSSKPKTINVKPFPETGKPTTFHGAVGNFQITSSLEKENFSTDEAGVLKVTILGSGNLQLITAPEIVWPNGIDAFDPTLKEQINNEAVPLNGVKTFTYNFNVNKEGSFTIPEILFSYFDPATAQYKTDKSPAIPFIVSKGTKPTKSSLQATSKDSSKPNWTLWISLAGATIIALTAIGIFSKGKKRKRNQTSVPAAKNLVEENKIVEPSAEILLPVNKNPLEQSQIFLANNQTDKFYSSINTELRTFLSQQFKLPLNELHISALQLKCDNEDVNNKLFLSLQNLMQKIEVNVYSPMHSEEEIQQTYNETAQIIEEIKYMCK